MLAVAVVHPAGPTGARPPATGQIDRRHGPGQVASDRRISRHRLVARPHHPVLGAVDEDV
jgi:hypothetical protein